MSTSRPTVYLAGPIAGQTFEGANDWREFIKEELDKLGITAFSPMRREEYLSPEQLISLPAISDRYGSIPITPKGITTRDRFDCERCDLVIAFLPDAARASIGTSIEIGWADAYRTPIIGIMPEREGNIHNHPMVTECLGYIVETLEDAVELTATILLP